MNSSATSHRNASTPPPPHLGIPQLASLVEGTGDDLVPPGVVECDGVHDVAVPVQRKQFVPCGGVPHLAG